MNPRRPPTDSLENQPLLLPADVPARVARWMAWLLLAIFAAAITFACAVRLPETVAAGFVLEPAQGVDPVVRLTVPESALSRLTPGQEVRLSYDAYPSQRYGSAVATLNHIGPAQVVNPGGSLFSATGTLQPGPAGHVVEPRPGLHGQARIVLGRRTLLQRFLEPLGHTPKPAVGK